MLRGALVKSAIGHFEGHRCQLLAFLHTVQVAIAVCVETVERAEEQGGSGVRKSFVYSLRCKRLMVKLRARAFTCRILGVKSKGDLLIFCGLHHLARVGTSIEDQYALCTSYFTASLHASLTLKL